MHLRSLTSLRFFAAFGVVLVHASQTFPAFPGAARVFAAGQLGVTFFFILSGFVLTWTHQDNDTAGRFYGRRFARIWPLHLVTAIAAAVLLISTDNSVSPFAATSVLTLTQAFVPSPSVYFALNSPSWTLSCEAFFYLLFPLAVVQFARSRRPLKWGAYVFGVIVIATVALFLMAGPVATHLGQSRQGLIGYIMTFFPPYRFGEFAIGILVGLAVRRGWRCPIRLSVALTITAAAFLSVAVALALIHQPSAPQLASVCLIPVFALLIASAATSDLKETRTILWNPVVVRLGRASFALYLVHWIIIHALAGVASVTAWLAALLAIGVSLLIADLAHTFVEQPSERRLRRLLGSRRPPVLAVDGPTVP